MFDFTLTGAVQLSTVLTWCPILKGSLSFPVQPRKSAEPNNPNTQFGWDQSFFWKRRFTLCCAAVPTWNGSVTCDPCRWWCPDTKICAAPLYWRYGYDALFTCLWVKLVKDGCCSMLLGAACSTTVYLCKTGFFGITFKGVKQDSWKPCCCHVWTQQHKVQNHTITQTPKNVHMTLLLKKVCTKKLSIRTYKSVIAGCCFRYGTVVSFFEALCTTHDSCTRWTSESFVRYAYVCVLVGPGARMLLLA